MAVLTAYLGFLPNLRIAALLSRVQSVQMEQVEGEVGGWAQDKWHVAKKTVCFSQPHLSGSQYLFIIRIQDITYLKEKFLSLKYEL